MMKVGVYWSKSFSDKTICVLTLIYIYYIALDLFCLALALLTLLHRKNGSQIIGSMVGSYAGDLSRLKW